MDCPVCKVDLMIADRQGIEIDYCPKCRGIWLDRGELDKIIERSAMSMSQGYGGEYREPHERHGAPHYQGEPQQHHGAHKKKRRSFLEDIFDFD